MSVLHHESLLETCWDEAWEEFRIHNKLTEDQLNELCWRNPNGSGSLDAIDALAQQKFEDLCQ
tara:strand:- start:655 stop:843 length:189 start_codon:yes stop_codon:yes gene_type:complete